MPASGKEMLNLFLSHGWISLRQRGSHIIVGKGIRRAVIPMHKELAVGLERTLRKILARSIENNQEPEGSSR